MTLIIYGDSFMGLAHERFICCCCLLWSKTPGKKEWKTQRSCHLFYHEEASQWGILKWKLYYIRLWPWPSLLRIYNCNAKLIDYRLKRSRYGPNRKTRIFRSATFYSICFFTFFLSSSALPFIFPNLGLLMTTK